MAYISYTLNRGALDDPDKIAIGTDDGGALGNITLAINQAASLTHQDVIIALNAFIRRLEDGRNTDLANV